MSKLLPTRLPLAETGTVTAELYNRLVRVLEINLSAVDPDRVPSYNDDEIDTLQFATGAIIFNTTREIHQAFDGNALRDLYTHQTYPVGLGATFSIGSVTVTIG
tara:strand:+ start:1071 stop:1382 length:312 start_codon:yes stop_codon:yes gene_type:complete